jgi:hypothetical protein
MNRKGLILVAFLLIGGILQAQDSVFLRKENRRGMQDDRNIITDRPPQAVYLEVFGRGGILSFNYDRRFKNRPTGLGFSVGAGYVNDGEFGILSVPISLNYLMGNRGKYFETGAGVSIFTSDSNIFDTDSNVLGHLIFGYRRQPINGGFNFRAGINVFVGDIVTPYPYVSFGYGF